MAEKPNRRKVASAAGSPARLKRFRIERLEERIAPKKGGKGTNNCGGNSSNTISGGCY